MIYLGSHPGVPADVVAGPQLNPPEGGHREEDMGVHVGSIQRIGELLQLTVNERPQRHCLHLHFLSMQYF